MIAVPKLRRPPAENSVIFGQILRFAVVGVFGFFVDTSVVYAARGALGLYGAAVLAFVVAATANWALNRVWTFRDRGKSGSARGQLARYLAVNLIGFVLNRGTFAIVAGVSPLAHAQPVIATAAGALAGMGINFVLSRRLVFR